MKLPKHGARYGHIRLDSTPINSTAVEPGVLCGERRQEIIRRHNDRWESINASTDRKLSVLEESLDDQLIANENEGGLISEEIKK